MNGETKMLRTTRATLGYPRTGFVDRLWRYSRRVEVDVFDWGTVVDSFLTSDPSVLKASLAGIYRHSSEARGSVRLFGIEEKCLPFGLRRMGRQVALGDLARAISFLES